MATATQVKAFITEIAPLIQKYAKEYGYKVCSPIIAQACCESAYGTSSLGKKYHNYFGMKCGSTWKGRSVNLKTNEEYTVGTYTQISANFRVYDSMEEGVKGYFEFISKTRYANLKTATTPKQYLEFIKADGYATSSTYVNTNMTIIEKNNLTVYDKKEVQPVTQYYPKYTGTSGSIVNALQTLKIDSNFSYRKKIATANNIKNYVGSPTQNIKMLTLLKQGKLIRV